MTRPISSNSSNHTAEALVVTCMDFRLVGSVASYLQGLGLEGNYDHVALAGAALGVMQDPGSAWARTFWDHLKLARELHGIKRVIVIDHRDCGACKALIGPDCADDPSREAEIHRQALMALSEEIRIRAPDLKVELALMDLDGSVTVIQSDRRIVANTSETQLEVP